MRGDEEIDAQAGREDRGETEGLRQDPDDGNGSVVEIDGAAENERVAAELLPPEGVSEKCDRCGALFMVCGKERAAEERAAASR